MSEDKRQRSAFIRKADGFEKKTSRLRRLNTETPDAFFKRLNALGYENGSLEKAVSHWNGDHNELHAGKTETCRLCRKALARSSKREVGEVRAEIPVKIGLVKPGRMGVSMLPLFFKSSFVEEVAKRPLSSIRLVITEPSQQAQAVSTAPAAAKSPAAPTVVNEVKAGSIEEKLPSTPLVVKTDVQQYDDTLKTDDVPLSKEEIAKAKKLDVVVSSPGATRDDILDHEHILLGKTRKIEAHPGMLSGTPGISAPAETDTSSSMDAATKVTGKRVKKVKEKKVKSVKE